jgi:hypothetical protein
MQDAASHARLAALEARLSETEHRLGLLEDAEAIKRLQRAYGYYLDKGLWREMAQLFSEDGTAEIAARGLYRGPERIYAFFKELMGDGADGLPYGRLLNHLQLQGIVTVADDRRTAKARWRAFIQSGRYGTDALWAEGPYEMEYVRRGDNWLISRLLWFPTFYAPYAEGWGHKALPRNAISDRLPPDEPPLFDHEIYPAYFVPPFHYPHPTTGEPWNPRTSDQQEAGSKWTD